jgi:hypothetical protein
LQAEESHVPRKSDLSFQLSRQTLLSHKAAYDLCVVSPDTGWLSSGKAARLASACLRPGGWLILIRAVTGAHCLLDDAEAGRRNRQVNALFKHLVVAEPKVHNSLRVGTLYAAQRVDTCASSPRRDPETTKLRMRVVHAAINLAAQDPDFRRALLAEPQSALSTVAARRLGEKRFPNDLFGCLIFHDSDHTTATLRDVTRDHLHLVLPAPVWHRPITECELEALIAEDAEQPSLKTNEGVDFVRGIVAYRGNRR